jgi:hypothetical protein
MNIYYSTMIMNHRQTYCHFLTNLALQLARPTSSPWQDEDTRLNQLRNLIKFSIPIKDFHNLLVKRNLQNTKNPQTIKEA